MLMTPADLHAIWRLLKTGEEWSREELETTARDMFVLRDPSILVTLLKQAHLVGLLERTDTVLRTTPDGKSLTGSSHWRCWQPSDAVMDRLGEDSAHWFGVQPSNVRPSVIDVFSGAGGLAAGFESAGFSVALAVDDDRQACEAMAANFPECTVIQEDAEGLITNELRFSSILSSVAPNGIVGVIGGPPCQGFSQIGERATDDGRNRLVRTFVDYVTRVQPDFFVMENVPGLQKFGAKTTFFEFVRDLAKPASLPAQTLIDSLPRLRAKRELPVRKRAISEMISTCVQNCSSNNRAIDCHRTDQLVDAIREVFADIQSRLIEMVRNMYKTGLSELPCNLARGNDQNLLEISIGIALRSLVTNQHLRSVELEDSMRSLVALDGLTMLEKITISSILTRYDDTPKTIVRSNLMIGPVLAEVFARTEEDYVVTKPLLLNADELGTPQHRERLFVVGLHRRLGVTTQELNDKFTAKSLGHFIPWAKPSSCEDAIGDLHNLVRVSDLLSSDVLSLDQLDQPYTRLQEMARLSQIEKDDLSLPSPQWNPFWVSCCGLVQHREDVVQRFAALAEGQSDKISRRTRLRRNGISHTLRAGTKYDKGSHTAGRPIHYAQNRMITVREGARLMGYPDWMSFHSSKWHGFRLVGNGVPRPVAWALARQIMTLLGG